MLVRSGGAPPACSAAPAVSGSTIHAGCRLSPKKIAASMPTRAAAATSQGRRSREPEPAVAPTACPHRGQNRAVGASAPPQARHGPPARGAPQCEQYGAAPGAPQEGQGVGSAVVMKVPDRQRERAERASILASTSAGRERLSLG